MLFVSVYLCVKWERVIVITSEVAVGTNELLCITWLEYCPTHGQHSKKDKADSF